MGTRRVRLQGRAHAERRHGRCRALPATRNGARILAACCMLVRLGVVGRMLPRRCIPYGIHGIPTHSRTPRYGSPQHGIPCGIVRMLGAHVLGELALELGDPRVLAFQERDQSLQHLSDASAVPSTVPSGRSHAGPNLAVNAHTLTCTDLRTQCPTLPVVALLNVVRCAVVNGVRPVSYAPCCTRVTQAHARIMPSAVAEGSSDALCCNVFYYVATDCTTVRTYFSALHKGRTGTSARTMPSAIAKGSSACKAKLSSAGGPWRAETHARTQANPQACAHAHERT